MKFVGKRHWNEWKFVFFDNFPLVWGPLVCRKFLEGFSSLVFAGCEGNVATRSIIWCRRAFSSLIGWNCGNFHDVALPINTGVVENKFVVVWCYSLRQLHEAEDSFSRYFWVNSFQKQGRSSCLQNIRICILLIFFRNALNWFFFLKCWNLLIILFSLTLFFI